MHNQNFAICGKVIHGADTCPKKISHLRSDTPRIFPDRPSEGQKPSRRVTAKQQTPEYDYPSADG
ncbi:MAG: hypothetical protein ACOCQP_00575 [Lentisphaeria bacterium]